MGNAGVEPNVHDVGFFFKFGAAAFALYACRNDILSVILPPSVRAFAPEQIGYSIDCIVIYNGLVAVFAVNYRDGNTPCLLAGNAPVGTVEHHALYSVLAPRRNPLNILDCLNGFIAEVLN